MSKYKIDNNNYYERLGLDPNSWSTITQEEIKDAFFDAVKIYPPQKEAEKFKLLREAYDTLNNKISRDEYNSENEYGEELKKLKEELEEAEKDEQINNQILILKKILIMQNKSCNYRNKLGLAFDNNQQYSLAIKQFELAIDINPDNSSYYINIGGSYENLEKYDDALTYYFKAHELDDESHTPPIRIAKILFHEKKQKTKAYDLLEKAINADGKIDFLDFFTIFTKTRFYALENKKTKLNNELKRIVMVAKSKEEKDIASYLLVQEAIMISEYHIYDIAEKFASAGLKMKPNDLELENMAANLLKYSKILKQCQSVQESSNIHDLIKMLISLYTQNYFGEIDKNEFEKLHMQSVEALKSSLDIMNVNMKLKESVKKIKDSWPEVYTVNSQLFNIILNSPSGTMYQAPCPYCSEKFNVKYGQHGTYTCPYCSQSVNYYGLFSKPGFVGDNSSDCFIAGAVYQSNIHPQVLFLRNFRDTILIKYFFGRLFIKFYYLFGPYGAQVIKKNTFLIKHVKKYILEPLIVTIKKGIK